MLQYMLVTEAAHCSSVSRMTICVANCREYSAIPVLCRHSSFILHWSRITHPGTCCCLSS